MLQSGGKRIRPVFVLLGAKFGNYDIHVVKHVAATLELIHTASLVHDDVVDDADLRRGSATIKSKWDNRVAMYTGDFIFARALEMMAVIESPLAHQILADTMVELCLGEIEQIKDKYNFEQNWRIYFRRIKRKRHCSLHPVASWGPFQRVLKREFTKSYLNSDIMSVCLIKSPMIYWILLLRKKSLGNQPAVI